MQFICEIAVLWAHKLVSPTQSIDVGKYKNGTENMEFNKCVPT